VTDAQLIRRVIKPALWILGLAPLLYLLNRMRLGDLGFAGLPAGTRSSRSAA
jgi:hypothetical protein